MRVNENQNRPKSGKQNNSRPSTAKPKIEKTEETQLETIGNINKNINQNILEKKISESDESNNYSKSVLINKSRSSVEKIDFLESLAKGSRRDSFLNLLDEEVQRIDKISEQKKKLNEIGLKENNIEGLYDWKTLFNHSRPISHYTRINYKEPIKTIEVEINNKIKSPKVLVDLPNDKMKFFFGKNSMGDIDDDKKKKKNTNKNSSFFRKSNNYNISKTISNIGKTYTLKSKKPNLKYMASGKIKSLKTSKIIKNDKDKNNIKNNNDMKNEKGHSYIKPTSLYGQYGSEDTFYFSNAFSDYYKEDLKTFSNKMPILKAKVKTNPNRLKRAIKKQRMKSSNKENKLLNIKMTDPLSLKKQDLIISAERGNPVPLMKSIYKQEYPDAVEIKENVKKYFNTMKPFGNDDGTTDYTKNDRWRLSRELIRMKKGQNDEDDIEENKDENTNEYHYGKTKKRKLILSYYNTNDPKLQIFKNLDEKKIKNISYEFKDDDNIDSKYKFNIEIRNEDKEEEKNLSLNIKKERKKDNNNLKRKQRPKTGFKRAKDINILNKEKIKISLLSKRPHSSNIRRTNKLSENKIFDIEDYNELYKDYLPSNRFPVKTSSKVNNTSYNKINNMIKERQKRKIMNDYFITQTDYPTHNLAFEVFGEKESLNISKMKNKRKHKIRPKTANGIRPKTKMTINNNNQNKEDKEEQKCSFIVYNNFINITPNLNLSGKNNIKSKGYFGPMNCFNKLAGKYYSSSNNVHVKNKRIKKKQILNTYYGDFGDLLKK